MSKTTRCVVSNEQARVTKTAHFEGPSCFHEFRRGDDVEIIAGPTPIVGGGSVPCRELTHFGRVIDPAYCPDPESVNILVVQWYQRIYDLLEAVAPEAPGDEIELVESMERTLVPETAVVQRISVANKAGTGARFFSIRNTRSFEELRAAPEERDRARPVGISTELVESPPTIEQ